MKTLLVQTLLLEMKRDVTFPNITKSPNHISNPALIWNNAGMVKGIGYTYNHLYLVSHEEIKNGDWGINTQGLYQRDDNYDVMIVGEKVIATSNKSLDIPFIPESLVREYIKSNGTLNEVELKLNLQGKPLVLYNEVQLASQPETVEEAAINYSHKLITLNSTITGLLQQAFEDGAKWQKEIGNN